MKAVVGEPASRTLPSRERVELILAQLEKLPPLPAIVTRLLTVTASDDSSAKDVVQLIRLDAALTAGILRLVRRADLGVGTRAVSVERAVTLLGFKAVRNAVLAGQFFEMFLSNDDAESSPHRRPLWMHCLATACAAELIAARVDGVEDPDVAFVCGLLHDIGKIALLHVLPKSYAKVVERMDKESLHACDAERELFGIDHTTAGRHVASRWGLSDDLVECIWLHHHAPDDYPSFVTSPKLVGIVHLADQLVRRAKIGLSGAPGLLDVDGAAAALELTDTDLSDVMELLPEALSPLCEMFGLDEEDAAGPSLDSLRQANQELSRLQAQLADENRILLVRSEGLQSAIGFVRRLTPFDRVGDVCAAASRTACEWLRGTRAVVFAYRDKDLCIHCGGWEAGENRAITSLLDRRESADSASLVQWADTLPLETWVAASAGSDAVWNAGEPGGVDTETRWAWLFRSATISGGILATASAGRIQEVQSAGAQRESWMTVVPVILATSWARGEAQAGQEELLDMNRRMRGAQRENVRTRSMAMIASMAAGAAHEMNNPLAVISGRAQMELATEESPELRRVLEIIIEQTQRASGIVQELMGFAKPDPPLPILQPVSRVLEAVCQHWRRVSGWAEDRICFASDDREATLFADASQVMESLNAVLANAIEACRPDTGHIRINSVFKASDETVRFTVEDNGAGMAPDVCEKALDPLYSNRPAGRGRGLGLSRAYRYAEINGGRLWIESKEGEGTKVHIELPSRPPSES